MKPKIINTIGLTLGIVGVLFLFIWGPPQPEMETGVSIGLQDATVINESGKTVADHNQEVRQSRGTHEFMSRVGLLFVMIGFAVQLLAVWYPNAKESMLSRVETEKEQSPKEVTEELINVDEPRPSGSSYKGTT